MESGIYTLFFFVPEDYLEAVKESVFAAGGGTVGDYQNCCWQVLGQGQFQPMAGSQPFTGSQGQLSRVAEWRVELLVEARHVKAAVAALKTAHPYEEVAYGVYALADF